MSTLDAALDVALDDATSAAVEPTRTAGISLLAAGPACIVCGVPFLWPALAAMGLGLGATLAIAHYISWLVVPVVVVLLVHNARRHGDRRPLRLAMAGTAAYAVHVVTHVVPAVGDVAFVVTDRVAVALLGAAALWDLAVTRRTRRRRGSRVRQGQSAAGAPAL